MQMYKMIKNTTLDIKIILKTYLKMLKTDEKYFRYLNKLLFYKILENNFQKQFLKIDFKNCF